MYINQKLDLIKIKIKSIQKNQKLDLIKKKKSTQKNQKLESNPPEMYRNKFVESKTDISALNIRVVSKI